MHTSAILADPLPTLAGWADDRLPIRPFGPGRYLVSGDDLVRTALASTTRPFEAKAATFGAVADWVPGSDRSRPVNAALGRELDRAWQAVPDDAIRAELATSREPWPGALAGVYLRLFGDQLFPGLPTSPLRDALAASDGLDRAGSALRRFRGRLAHSRADAALHRWAAGNDGALPEALRATLGASDDVALALHGLVGAVCRAASMVAAWTILLDRGWRPGTPAGTILRPRAGAAPERSVRDPGDSIGTVLSPRAGAAPEHPVLQPGDPISTIPRPAEAAPAEHRVREALRLWPVAWQLARTVTEATELGGVDLVPGDRLYLCTYLLHRDPDFWSEPGEYRPQRWDRPPESYKARYLPYGFGSAACVGSRFVNRVTARVVACSDALDGLGLQVVDPDPVFGSLLAPPVVRPVPLG
ncbi:cytochrome P450 [Amycolatopsis sp. RTGN1]|uniref:cytochrome P450 n=1 Tax=Amycolatopsis ponsaeliensis TaxID=2992142 RepID=UPI00254FB135|nr:cytochrome P450 [Amycolatopsis sp. RTGN1]